MSILFAVKNKTTSESMKYCTQKEMSPWSEITFKVLCRGISGRVGCQTCSLWTGLKTKSGFHFFFFLNKHMLLVLPSCPFHFITCCDTLDTEEPLRFRESPWQTVSKELGRIERKSLKDRRRTVSLSSFVDSKGTTGRGNSLDSNGSSVLLYRPNALATPSKVGTVYLHRYSVQEKE